jgi:hypothetical protein
MKASHITAHVAGAAMFTGAAAWALHQQANYVIAALVCGSGARAMWGVSALAIALLIAGGLLSWRALKKLAGASEGARQDSVRVRRFLANIAVPVALIFFFAILMQICAMLFLPACLR